MLNLLIKYYLGNLLFVCLLISLLVMPIFQDIVISIVICQLCKVFVSLYLERMKFTSPREFTS